MPTQESGGFLEEAECISGLSAGSDKGRSVFLYFLRIEGAGRVCLAKAQCLVEMICLIGSSMTEDESL